MKEEKKRIFRGVATALVTPMRESGEIDEESLATLIEGQIEGGVSALVIAGTTGEAATLETWEHKALVKRSVALVQGRIPVIAGVGGTSTSRCERLAAAAAEAGADGILAVTPYYNKGNAEGLVRHFTALETAGGIPILLYTVPGRTGADIPLAVSSALAAHPGVVGVKEASGHPLKAARIIAETDGNLPVYSGSDEVTVPLLALGGEGVVSVVSGILPRETVEMTDRFFAGDVRGAAERQLALLPLIDALFSEVNPIPVKTALAMLGLCGETMRLPLSKAAGKTREALRGQLSLWGLLEEK